MDRRWTDMKKQLNFNFMLMPIYTPPDLERERDDLMMIVCEGPIRPGPKTMPLDANRQSQLLCYK